MTDNSNRSDPSKKDYTLSLCEEEIEKLSLIFDSHICAERMALIWGFQSAANAILNVCYHSDEYGGIQSEW
jgi:hypothetical protein